MKKSSRFALSVLALLTFSLAVNPQIESTARSLYTLSEIVEDRAQLESLFSRKLFGEVE